MPITGDSEETSGGGLGQEGPPPESQASVDVLADLGEIVQDLKNHCVQLANDISTVAAAQWRLTSYVVTGSARIWVVRCAVFAIIGVLSLGGWVFLNVAVWRSVEDLTVLSSAPPLALFILNVGVAGILYFWQKGLRLQ